MPMSARISVLAVSLLAGLTGCAVNPSPAKTVPLSQIAPLTDDQLGAMLLRAVDLPSGYAEDPAMVTKGEALATGNTVANAGDASCELMAAFSGQVDDPNIVGTASTGFVSARDGLAVGEALLSDGSDGVEKHFAELGDSLARCPSFTTSIGSGISITMTYTPMSYDKIGDGTTAFAVGGSVAPANAALAGFVVLARTGRTFVMLESLGFAGKTPDKEVFEQLVRKAVANATTIA